MPAKKNLLDLTPSAAREELAAVSRARSASRRIAPAGRRASVAETRRATLRGDDGAAAEPPRTARRRVRPCPASRSPRDRSRSDGTEKFLFRLHDNEAIETVAIPEGDRVTLCISSQAGCALAVRVLRDRRDGLHAQPHDVRDRRSGARDAHARSTPINVTNIVFMGMGEPLMNWKAVDPTLTTLNDPRRTRHRRAPHHDLDRRRAAGHRRARRTSGAVPPRDLDPRAERLAAPGADADQHQVSAART